MNFKLLGILAVTATLVGCATPQKPMVQIKPQKTIFDEIYRPPESLMPKRVEGIKPSATCPRYIKVWVGSYRDKRGNFVQGGWIWLKIRDCIPETNF